MASYIMLVCGDEGEDVGTDFPAVSDLGSLEKYFDKKH